MVAMGYWSEPTWLIEEVKSIEWKKLTVFDRLVCRLVYQKWFYHASPLYNATYYNVYHIVEIVDQLRNQGLSVAVEKVTDRKRDMSWYRFLISDMSDASAISLMM